MIRKGVFKEVFTLPPYKQSGSTEGHAIITKMMIMLERDGGEES